MIDESDRWCILRTSPGRTLPLARSLEAAGFEVWTPTKIIRRPAPGQRRRLVLGMRRDMVEVALPILPSFLFAAADRLDDLLRVAALPFGPHPSFAIFRHGDRVPLVGGGCVAGLRDAEAEAAAAIQAERDQDDREAARQRRAEMLRTDRAKRKALRSQRRDFDAGARVVVDGLPALAGLEGRIVQGRGTTALIDFGGTLTMKVEAWRVRPSALHSVPAHQGAAA